ncbi:Crp/Fnr family transcriptional regulator [Tianweitania sp. BSSL-BM11]|uniref:Crp/Fnr family transcriptional regulator n=1 Tax=Tianweitania aestuarii TaxID=2814886 RepID=A0ABS5RQF3_9HYPH|nr:Crp/Fnr family transcriptional regulator [Tianweitania aestuarii]
MPHPLITYFERRDSLSTEEKAILERITHNRESFPARTLIIRQGSQPARSCVLLQGIAFREHLLRSGKRMISAVHIAGDFLDLHGLLLAKMDHDVRSAGECTVAWIAHKEIVKISETHPHLGRLLWMTIAADASLTRAAVSVVGRLNPPAKLAHMACELYLRMADVGLARNLSFDLAVTQLDLADMFGLSTVHLNRSMQVLRSTGAISWEGQRVVIHDWDRLTEIAEFDPTYLNLEPKRR